MANFCTIKDSQKYQALKEMSGISDDSLAQVCNQKLELEGRYPELDEIDADSSKYLEEEYDIKTSKSGTKYANTQMVKDINGKETIEEINASINDVHRDLDVKITDINGVSIFEIKSRPNEYKIGNVPYSITATSDTQVQCGIIESLNKMRNQYGINIIPITSDDDFPGLNVNQAKAFIYNGNIYVNIDNATIDSPIHEMLHILLGSMSRYNPQLFYQLVNSVEAIPNYQDRVKYYPNRTRSDINEEIFVEELSKHLTNQSSIFDNLEENTISQIMYYLQRDLDTIFDGNYSVRSLDEVFNCSLKELAELTESNIFNIENGGSLNPSTIHRMLANIKEQYLKTNELTENCE